MTFACISARNFQARRNHGGLFIMRTVKVDQVALRDALERQQRIAAYYAARAELAAANAAAMAEAKSGAFHLPPDELIERVGELERATRIDRSVSITEAAARLKMPVSTIRAWCNNDDVYLRCAKVGAEWRVDMDSLIAHVAALAMSE